MGDISIIVHQQSVTSHLFSLASCHTSADVWWLNSQDTKYKLYFIIPFLQTESITAPWGVQAVTDKSQWWLWSTEKSFWTSLALGEIAPFATSVWVKCLSADNLYYFCAFNHKSLSIYVFLNDPKLLMEENIHTTPRHFNVAATLQSLINHWNVWSDWPICCRAIPECFVCWGHLISLSICRAVGMQLKMSRSEPGQHLKASSSCQCFCCCRQTTNTDDITSKWRDFNSSSLFFSLLLTNSWL